jgi:structural maintenance of chromosome 3 (chondroitin sulfate proteoglycan 6)
MNALDSLIHTQDERVALLHEGSGSAAVTAYVEICLDNADGRLPFDAQQVVLRRTIGVSKDEFFLQRQVRVLFCILLLSSLVVGRHDTRLFVSHRSLTHTLSFCIFFEQRCSKSEVQSLLEGAGFSKSNPYYIVQQGKVQDLCTMRDDARLQLLKEVAGTTVYDARKASSLTQMVENATNRAQITDLLADLQTRLEALQAEQAELVQYQRLDKSRRALEYSLYDKEWIKARALLESCEEERARHAQDLQGLDEAAKEIHDMIRNTEASVAAHATGRQRNARLLANQQEDFFASVQHLAAQGLQLAELREALAAATSAQASNAGALEDLTQQIATHQASLESRVTPAWQAATQALEGSKTNKATVDQKIQGLYAKQGRGRHFESVADRDVFLQQRLDELETQRVAQEQQQSQEAERLAHLRRSVQENDQERGDLASQVTKHSHDHESLTKTLEEQNRARQECQEERKMVWRQRETLQDQVREARDALGKATADSKKTTPRATALGLEALKTIVEQEGLVQGEHYFGAVVDNFQMRDAKYQTAVEVAAQNALFHVIVDTDETASRLLRKLEEGRLGRVTFLPLEQLRLEKSFLPTNNPDVRPLLEHCLEFDPKVERALRHVFGKKLLCRSMDLATEWSKKLGVDGITLDGDLCSRKGSMTGGYVDLSKSRLRAYESQRTALAKLAELEGESRKVEHEAQKTEQQLNAFMQEVQRLGAKHAQLGNLVTQKDAKVDRLDQKKLQTLKSIETVEKTTMPPLLRELATCEKEMERLREEIGTELVETLSEEDRTLLEELKGTQAELQADIQTQTDNVSKVSLERQKLQSMLHDNLFKRRRELLDSAKGRSIVDEDDEHRASHAGASFAASIAQKRDELEELEREIDEAKRVKEQIQARSDEARVTDQRLQEEESKARNDLEQLRGEDMQYAKRFEEAQTKSERMLNKVRCNVPGYLDDRPLFVVVCFF